MKTLTMLLASLTLMSIGMAPAKGAGIDALFWCHSVEAIRAARDTVSLPDLSDEQRSVGMFSLISSGACFFNPPMMSHFILKTRLETFTDYEGDLLDVWETDNGKYVMVPVSEREA